MGGLLESKDLPSVWPFRVLLTKSEAPAGTSRAGQFVLQNGQYILICAPGTRLPLGQAAGILLDANTPRLPAEIESGLRELFDSLEAKGSRVTWGGSPAHPDLAWARVQLFATKFEYTLSFHIFLAALKGGSGLQAAEQNAFGKASAVLEQEAQANLAAGRWQAVPVSGRPLDPKRDFGEHSIEGLDDLKAFLSKPAQTGVRSALGYVAAAKGLPPDQAIPLLKKAAQTNPLWAEPVFLQAQLTSDPAEKETLLKRAVQLDPRATPYWVELAQVQTTAGQATAAQGSWLRAEDSAPSPAEREQIHQLRLGSEKERLDAAENAQRREREALHLADERAQQSEAERIRAAEAKANQSLDAAAGGAKPENVVPWDATVPRKRLEGILVRVDCLGRDARIWIKDKAGATIQLLLKNAGDSGLTCGPQQPARLFSVTYAAQPNERLRTSGTVLSLGSK